MRTHVETLPAAFFACARSEAAWKLGQRAIDCRRDWFGRHGEYMRCTRIVATHRTRIGRLLRKMFRLRTRVAYTFEVV